MNIKFANGTKFEYLNALETEQFYNGASRRTLTFECAVGVMSIDELNTLLSNEANTSAITLTGEPVAQYNENNEIIGWVAPQNIYESYVLKLEIGVKNKLIKSETPETPAIYEDRLIFKLGKRTYIEECLAKLGM